MKREAKMLLDRALDSVILAVEHFNRPVDYGRPESVLIQLDHSFELFLKAAIIHRGGRIWKPRRKQTIGFEACINECLLQPEVKFLTSDEAMTLRVINSLRDAACHYVVLLSEDELYLHTQAGITLFDSLLRRVFRQQLADVLPERVLPVSTKPPEDLMVLFDSKLQQIKALVAPGKRQKANARASLRSLALVENAIREDPRQPSDQHLDALLSRVQKGEALPDVFPGVASVVLDAEGSGLTVSLQLTKSKGIPVRLVKEGEKTDVTVAVKRVGELSFYSLGLHGLAEKLSLTPPKTLAVVRYLNLQDDTDCFKEFSIGSVLHKRYSPIALERIREALPGLDMDKVWKQHGSFRRRQTVRKTRSI